MKRILRPHLQYFLDYLRSIPDYDGFFNDNPNAAYTILTLAASLALVGNFQLPKPRGLHLIVTSQLLASLLLVFMGFKDIAYSPIKLICSCASLVGLSTMVLFPSTDQFERSAEVVGFSIIYAWSGILVLSPAWNMEGVSRDVIEAYLAGLVFIVLIIVAIAITQVVSGPDLKARMNKYVPPRTAANVVIFNTILLVLSQLAKVFSPLSILDGYTIFHYFCQLRQLH